MKFYDVMLNESKETLSHINALIEIFEKKIEKLDKLPESEKKNDIELLSKTIKLLKLNGQQEYNMYLYAKGIKENREEEFYRDLYEKGIVPNPALEIKDKDLSK